MAIAYDRYADKPVVAVATMPLSRAVICPDDETVFDISYRQCPSCGGETIMPLARWLGSTK